MLDALRRMLNTPVGTLPEIDLPVPFSTIEEPPPTWHFSSFELMNGVDVSDFSETITGDQVIGLFRR